MDRQPVLEGERLRLRPLRAGDWDALFAVAADRELWAGHPAHDRWQEPVFREYFGNALANGGALAVIDKATGGIIGASQYYDYQPGEDGRGPSVEIGFTFLARSHWGGADNAEMKRLMLAHALAAVEYVRFRVGETNVRSRRAMEKIGGRLTERRQSEIKAGQPSVNVIYEIDRAAFAAGSLAPKIDRQPTLEGEQLLLRPLRPSDWKALYAVAADPLVWEVHPAHDRWQEPVFRAFFDEALAEGGALLAIRKADGKPVGSSQFRACPIKPDELEIGWTFLARESWGTGLNPEMKRLMLMHGLARYPRVLFRIGETNIRSRKAIEAIGGRLTELVEDGEYKGLPVRHVVYEIDRECFAAGPLAR